MKYFTYDALSLNGRLGNQLWQIAATIGEAERSGGLARLNPKWEYREFFSVPDEFFEWVPRDAEVIDGGTDYFQELHYFANVADKVREYFSPSPKAAEIVDTKYEYYFNDRITCALHVRRGDYLKHPNHFPIMSSEYFHQAVDAQDENTIFVVFSDDMEWCRKNKAYLGLEDETVAFMNGIIRPVEVELRFGKPEDWLDLFLISKCKNHIISNSTFSWWGAWLSGDPDTIYPSRWFGRGVPNWENWERAIPASWRKFNS